MDIDPKQYAVRNWDGYDAEPIPQEVFDFAAVLVELFKTPPEYAPGADGSIGFEWLGKDCKVFLDVFPGRVGIYARVGEKRLTSKLRNHQ